MRAAIIFPPQWDPRQPPLGPAVLARSLDFKGTFSRIFDLNLSLYRNLLHGRISGGIEDYLVKRLLDPKSLKDARAYLELCQQTQKIFDERFDPNGHGRLFWDTAGGIAAPSSSANWRSAAEHPESIPFTFHLKNEIDEIIEWKPETIIISAIADTQIIAAISLAAIFRRALPDSRIFLGGAAITYRRSLLDRQEWLDSIFNSVCPGEGESLLATLNEEGLQQTVSSEKVCDVANKSQIDKSNSNLASAWCFPDFSGLPLDKYLTPHLVIPVETARGCPWSKCSFCIHPIRAATGSTLYRPKPVEAISAELKRLFDHGHRRFLIIDEALPPSRMKQLAEIFLSFAEPVAWIAYIRLDEGHSQETFKLARSSGCLKLFIGVESGSNSILCRFNKGVNAKRARRVLLDAAAAGLAMHSFLMTGFPGEEEVDRQATLELLADVWPAFASFGISYDLFMLSAELETELTLNPQKFGWPGPVCNDQNDLAWQFPVSNDLNRFKKLAEFKRQIDQLAEHIFGSDFGLRHASLAQDSLHLLLIEARA